MAAPTAILYDGKRLIPAPQLQFSRNHRRSGDQSIIGTEHQVTLSGTLAGCKGWDFTSGSPEFYTGNDYPADDTISTCNKFANIVEMQDKLRELFSVNEAGEYGWFEVIGCDGLIRKWRARVISLDFPEGQWTDIAPYTITLGLQTDNSSDDDLHIDHSESWDVQFEEEQGGIYSLSHTLSCQSEEFASNPGVISDGWIQAKSWLDTRIAGSDYTGGSPDTINNDLIFTSTGFNLVGYTSYDYTIQKSIDEFGGTYSITETWTLAKDPVFRTWTTNFSDPRDDYSTVSIEGEFRSFLNRTESTETAPTNASAALDAFNAWGDAGAYSEANAAYSGCGTLGSCAVNKSVTITEESRGDATATYGEATRTVQFSYEFSDSDPDAEVSITRATQTANFETCETRVTINGSIQGHTCDCGTTKLENAQTAYAAVDCATEAAAIYSGVGTLQQVSSTYSENEKDGTVEFSCEFSDRFTGDYIEDERITVGWTCGDLGSDGTSKTTHSVEGSRKAICSGSMPTAKATSAYNCDGAGCCVLKRTSVTRDETAKVVNWNYEWDDDCGPGLVEITVEKNQGPGDCAHTQTTVNFSSQGIGCDSATMLANAQSALTAAGDPSDYAVSGSCQMSYKENKNTTRGSIQRSYIYTTQCDASLNVTTTDTFDATTCDDSSHSVEGEIKGHCWSGQMAAAETLFLSHQPDDYANGSCLISSRIARNDNTNSIRFNYEFKTCEDGYEHTQTISTKTDEQDCCGEVSVSGNITPYCDADTGEAGMVAVGEAAWGTIQSTLSGVASGYCADTTVLRSTSVSRNQNNGQISYTYNYSCCDTCSSGVLKESVNITRDFAADVVAIVPILGRTCGPIIQNKGTKTVAKCTVSIDLLFSKDCDCGYGLPSGLDGIVAGIISSAGCCSTAYGTYTEKDTESWNPRTGKYTRNVTFICECC